MDVFIGIDPSLNSSGICILKYDGDKKIKEYFGITKPNKLTKKEQEAQDKYLFFDYHIYTKKELKDIEDTHVKEIEKTLNYLRNANTIIDIIRKNTVHEDNVYVVQEGISYGSSIRTKSVFDLAGLNYVLRLQLARLGQRRFNNGIYAAFIPPTEIKKFATGSGNCKKEIICNQFKMLYPKFDLPKIDDVCDAYYMALYAKYMKDNDYECFK